MGMEILWFRHFTLLLGEFRAVFSLLLTVILIGIGVVLGYHGETASLDDLIRAFRAWNGDSEWDPARLRQGGDDPLRLVRRNVDVGPSNSA